MNRHHRRAEAAKTRASRMRHAAIRDAIGVLAAIDDDSVEGATLFLPDGQTLYLSAEMARPTPRTAERAH